MNKNNGFTLLEMLLVIAIIAILAGIVIVAINPAKQLGDANNTKRSSDIRSIRDAVQQHVIDNGGLYHGNIPNSFKEICDTGHEQTGHNINCNDMTDLSFLVPTYIQAIPKDPSVNNSVSTINNFVNVVLAQNLGNGTGYVIKKASGSGVLTIAAPYTQNIGNDDPVIYIGERVFRGDFNLPDNPPSVY